MRISDWSSDVCSSDLGAGAVHRHAAAQHRGPAGREEISRGLRIMTAERLPTDWKSDAMRRRIARRYAAERRFRAAGLFAVLLSAAFLDRKSTRLNSSH